MPLRNNSPVLVRPKGVSDAQDGTNSFAGAMLALGNLVLAYHTDGVFVPRPAAIKIVDFNNFIPTTLNTTGNTTNGSNAIASVANTTGILNGFTVTGSGIPAGTTVTSVVGSTVNISANATATATGAALTFASPPNPNGIISEFVVVGMRVYGMVSSVQYSGKDEPFCYDMGTNSFVYLSGVSNNLLPTSPPSTGDWIPPVLRAINNVTLVCAHSGFIGGSNPFFGWIDTSSYSQSILGNTTNGSNVISSVYTTVGLSAPILQGVQPGQLITNANFPVGTYVISATNGAFALNTTGNTHGTTTLDGLASTTNVAPGMTVTGGQFASGTYVTAVVSGTQVTLNQAALGTATGTSVNFSGGGSITVSNNATGTATLTSLSITGGTPTAPRWGAGNTNTNPLTVVPKTVYGFNGRCYYGVGPFLTYSDPQLPLQVSLTNQTVQIGDGTDITALAGVPLTSQLTGGVQQSMTIFKGAGTLYQVTGDAASNNFLVNAVTGSVGTLAPRSIVGTPSGTTFMAVDGLRTLGLSGTLSEPLNTQGQGVAVPFLNALFQSRMCAAYAENIYRITTQDGSVAGNPIEEFWFDINKGVWTGPHTLPTRAAQAYTTGASFVVAPWSINGQLWRSDAIPTFNSSYIENGTRITCTYTTVLLPDNQGEHWNKVVQGRLSMALASSDSVNVNFIDDHGNTMATCAFNGQAPSASLWQAFSWGSGTWGNPTSVLREYLLKLPNALVFRQAKVSVTFPASSQQAIGNLYFSAQPAQFNDV